MAAPDDRPNPIQIQDEILQVLYWMRGEQLGEVVALAELNRFLGQAEPALQRGLEGLVGRGYVGCQGFGPDSKFSLTEAGVAEGRRRFQEEFDGLLGHESHLACDDPNCDCHAPGNEANCLTRVH